MKRNFLSKIMKAPLVLFVILIFLASIYTSITEKGNFIGVLILGIMLIFYFVGGHLQSKEEKK